MNKINRYVRGYAKRNNITTKEALKKEIVQNVVAWIRLREGRTNNEKIQKGNV